jgi:hypothetical protein
MIPLFLHIPISIFILFFQFCDVAQVAIIQKYIYIAKLADIQNMQVEKFLSTFHIEGNCGIFFSFFWRFLFETWNLTGHLASTTWLPHIFCLIHATHHLFGLGHNSIHLFSSSICPPHQPNEIFFIHPIQLGGILSFTNFGFVEVIYSCEELLQIFWFT